MSWRRCPHCEGCGRVPAPLVEVWVPGVPRGKGSPDVMRVQHGRRAGKGFVREKTATIAWEKSVRTVARFSPHGLLVDAPVALELGFLLPRIQTTRGRDDVELGAVPPDIDKLARAVLDGLQRELFVNDSRVTRLLATKRAAPAGAPRASGVRIGFGLDLLGRGLLPGMPPG